MLIIFYILSLIILASTIGYGLLFKKILPFNVFQDNFGLLGLLGLFFLSLFSSYSHIIMPHNYYHNLLIVFIGIVFLLIFQEKKNLKNIFIIFSILFLAILLSKNNEDFGYYHLPNSLQFAQQKLQFGLGNLNHGFKHISTLFMLMSLNYFPKLEYYLFNLTNLMFYVFFITFLYEIIIKEKKVSNFTKIIFSLFFVLFLTKFSRLAEFGSDISGQIIIVVYLFFVLELVYNLKLSFETKISYLKLAGILIIFAISLKFISVIYSLFLIPVFYFFKNIERKKLFFKILNFRYCLVCFFSIFIFIFLNLTATGCLIYPVEKLCFDNYFLWALDKEIIKYLNLHYELWAKGGLGPNISVETSPTQYVSSLNWIKNWISVYFFNKFLDYILVSLFIIFIFYIFYFKNSNLSREIIHNFSKKNKIFLVTSFMIFMIWFLNFPTLRYAGYVIVFFLIIFPFSIFLTRKIDFKKYTNLKKLKIILSISLVIFLVKNITRIHNEFNISHDNHHNFKDFPFFWIKNAKYEKIEINDHILYKVNDACWSTKSTCVRNTNNLKVLKKNNYIIYINEKN